MVSKPDDFEFITRHRALTQPHYWFEIDEYRHGSDQMLLAHLRFSKFSPSILRNALKDWAWFRECVSAPIFAYGEGNPAKFARFVHLFGFKSLNTDVVWEGKSRRLYLHTKDFGICPARLPLPAPTTPQAQAPLPR